MHFNKDGVLYGSFHIVRQIHDKYDILETFIVITAPSLNLAKSLKRTGIDWDIQIQFKRCCEQLGIQLITNSVAQAKGWVE